MLKTTGALGAFAGIGAIGSASARGETKELVVKKSDVVGIADVKSAVETALPSGASIVHKNDVLGYVTIEVPLNDVGTAADAMSTLEAQSAVEYAEENVTYHTMETASDDPHFGSQYTPQQVDAPEAWNTTQGEDVLLSVIDQGVDYEHENLHDRFGSNLGYDFAGTGGDDPMPVQPSENHGTHVAGIAAATTNNGIGTSGISNAQILSARALDESGGGSLQDIADAIQWSADQNADVINMSLGGGGFTDLMNDAINYAFDSGTLPIAAAGNDGGSVNYPAAYDNCVAISAIDSNYNAASFTSRGPEIDVTAGGVDVLSTDNNDSYVEMSGTSMSSPVAAGVACLGASAHGLTGSNQDPGQLWNLLISTAEPVDGLASDVEGEGLANAANIVGGGDPPEEHDLLVTVVDDSGAEIQGATVSAGGDSGTTDQSGQVTLEVPEGTVTVEAEADGLSGTEEVDVTGDTSVTVEIDGEDDDPPGECGAESNTASAEGELSGGWWGNPSDTYTYELETADPCAATITLDGPSSGAVFDLYLTLDGREPSTWDYDERSYNWGADEQIDVELDGSETFGILVDRYDGSGSYTLTVEELGK
ncbi:S8 family serine peptidase [Halovivax gelatinilyticus]|uniref:S8 family serine peptidase n=1 Tax=Halovivax gelatinilyticus TaxID=2961597 RepID=UPI0020CA694E|nr:S8 family serine peptidase [Halovivax gelatinilyticus]